MASSKDILNDINNILFEFGYKAEENKYNCDNQKYLWEIIINIRDNMKNEIEHALRMNFNLCFLLEEENQSKELNSELLKISHLLDQNIYRLDNNPKKGLKDFHKILISTYGDISIFIQELKVIKENLSFVRKRKDFNLINYYIYLKKISLPLKGYEELRIALITILKKFTELKVLITNPDIFALFIKEIDFFIKRYQSFYRYEHERFHKKLHQFHIQLYNLQEYKALECLSKIRIINVVYNLKPIKKYIDTFFPDPCYNKNLEEILEKQVKCCCGFTLGEILTIPSLSKIKPMLRKGINEYLEKIQSPRFKPLFSNYLSYNEDSSVKKFLEFKIDKIGGNIEYINDKLVSELNKALSNTYPLKISIDEIISNITGTYPVTEIDLLAEDIKEKVMEIIRGKVRGIEKVNNKDIIINLVN